MSLTTLLGAVVALAAHAGVALAQAPAPAGAPQPSYAPIGEPMTFRLAEGAGPGEARRWVSATGQIQAGTPAAFLAFARDKDLQGVPLVLDSTGGRVTAAMALGRAVRAARMNASVGRTIRVGDQDAVRTTDVGCFSACPLVLMGGVERFVPEDARIALHMFSVELDAEGNKSRGEPSFRDIEQAQRTMARHAVYLSEMGVNPRYLEIMTEASFRGEMRRLSNPEIVATKLASITPRAEAARAASIWSISAPSAQPQLVRGGRLEESDRMVVDHELVLECDTVRGFLFATYRQRLVRLAAPRQEPLPVLVNSVRLDTGGWDYVMRAPTGRGLGIANPGGDLWMRRSIPRKVFEDAAANGRLDIEITATGKPKRVASLHDASLGRHLPEFARRCDARPGLVSVGGNPRR